MFNIFKKKPRTFELRLVELCEDGYCAVVGESHYQDVLLVTKGACTAGPGDRPTFTAALIAEPDNPYDPDAIAVYSPEGKVGYLSRDDAPAYRLVLEEVARLGYHGGACEAYLTGGEPDKPSFGVVLQLADPGACLAELPGDDVELNADDDDRPGPGFVRGKHFTEYVEKVKELRRSDEEAEAEKLLLELIDATEAEARANDWGVAPWYYEQLAISYRKRGDIQSEIAVLDRFARQRHSPGGKPPQLLERLAKARALAQRG